MAQPLVSIIVPLYNLENYVDDTLHSLIAQDYQNLEILLIDDHSSDQTLRLAHSWQQKDSRIQVFTFSKHQGVSPARNKGIEVANGEFISFVDGDDQLEPSFISTLVTQMKPEIGAAAVGYHWGYGFSRRNHTSSGVTRLARRDFYRSVNSFGDPIGGYIWNKLFRQSVIKEKQLRFDESLDLAEDLLFTAEYIANAPQSEFSFDASVLYNKINRPDSTIHSASRSMRQTEHAIRTKIDQMGERLPA